MSHGVEVGDGASDNDEVEADWDVGYGTGFGGWSVDVGGSDGDTERWVSGMSVYGGGGDGGGGGNAMLYFVYVDLWAMRIKDEEGWTCCRI